MDSNQFHYIIIGAGAAGLHLALAMADDEFFDDKKILIIDKDRKEINDRTWCFWEEGKSKWDGISHKIWSNGIFRTSDLVHHLDMNPYCYKMIRGIDFYKYCKKELSSKNQFKWIHEEVLNVKIDELPEVDTGLAAYTASHIFDSRIEYNEQRENGNTVKVLQHFKGWVIDTMSDAFDDERFTMMDFRVGYNDCTCFMYVLPTSKKTALIEFTFFTPDLIKESEYDEVIKNYIADELQITEYKITETEMGVIPMTNYPFHKQNSNFLTKIGTAGSWVKPSSGYSFKNAIKFSTKVIDNIKSGKSPSNKLIGGRFRKYDTLFLEILQNHNKLGPKIFKDMYVKNKTSQIFKFLDEETTFIEDFKIISSFEPEPFRKALAKHWKEWLPME